MRGTVVGKGAGTSIFCRDSGALHNPSKKPSLSSVVGYSATSYYQIVTFARFEETHKIELEARLDVRPSIPPDVLTLSNDKSQCTRQRKGAEPCRGMNMLVWVKE